MVARVPVLPPDVQRQVDAELRNGEKLVWADQPSPGAYGRQAIGIVIFGIPWTAFSIFWVYMAAGGMNHFKGDGPPIFFPLFGVPFILIGIGMLTSPIWLRRKALRTVYILSDQRVIILTTSIFGGIKVQTFMPERLGSMVRNERANGSGDLIFEQFMQGTGDGRSTIRRGFMGVARVREVEDLIMATLVNNRAK